MGAETATFGTTTTPRALAFYGSGRVVQYSEGGSEKLAYSTTAGGSWTAYSGTYSPVDTSLLRMKFVEANQNLYFNTSVGPEGAHEPEREHTPVTPASFPRATS
jgi:hypothetical protein